MRVLGFAGRFLRGVWRSLCGLVFALLSLKGRSLGFWKIPDQVARVGVLLVLAIVGLIVARARFIPETFGDEGHYRAAARTLVASQPIKYAGWQVCAECHDEEAEAKAKSYHRMLSCETCHGASSTHAEEAIEGSFENRPVVPSTRGACLMCHGYLPSRPTGFPQIVELHHNPTKPCMKCHNPHDPKPPSEIDTCAACHAQIARSKAVSHHNPLACETCHDAAPEHSVKPRAHLPKKPSERAFCGKCHGKNAPQPEGIEQRIPRVDLADHGGTYLCWQCHYPHFPEAR